MHILLQQNAQFTFVEKPGLKLTSLHYQKHFNLNHTKRLRIPLRFKLIEHCQALHRGSLKITLAVPLNTYLLILVYVNVGADSTDTGTVTMTWGNIVTAKQYNIFVQQIECSSAYK